MSLSRFLGQTSFLRLLYHKVMGWLAAARYGFPGRKLRIIGVTGTDGKTSTCYFTAHVLEKSGLRVGLATTVGFQIGERKWKNTTHKTTMGRFGLQKLLAEMVRADVDVVVLEVSSHGLVQSRLMGVLCDTAVITNLSREHLDYHGTMEAYRNAKGLLFQKLRPHGTSIVCSDFDEARYYLAFPAKRHWTYGTSNKTLGESHAEVHTVTQVPGGYDMTMKWEGASHTVHIPLFGAFNVLNAVAAFLAATSVGIAPEKALRHLESLVPVPGRMEPLMTKRGVQVLIDYAVTPMALTAMYSSLSEVQKRGKLIAILGACGDRDQGKRPEMGKIATSYCDKVYFTNEEPYTEDPEAILAMLVSGAVGDHYQVIPDRKEAIVTALQQAEAGDIVVISGMGDQASMIVQGKKIPWSDREVVQGLLATT